MRKLLIIADDFTGALDSGVQFATCGAKTVVVTNPDYDFSQADAETQVLVFDSETRHLEPKAAYNRVYRAVRQALDAGFAFLYKKTDSGLRGNIGSELTAVMDAAGADSLVFAPAYPKMNRCTENGVHYIDGVPVAESVFGQDPFDPVRASAISDIVSRQVNTPVVIRKKGESSQPASPGIQVYDARTDEDLARIGRELGAGGLRLSAGCAGFAKVLADVLKLHGDPKPIPKLSDSLFIACGSVNPVTIRQMRRAEAKGFAHVHLTPIQKLDRSWIERESSACVIREWLDAVKKNRRFILDVNDPENNSATLRYARAKNLSTEDLRVQISTNLGYLMKRLLDEGLDATLLCTGGDTLLALMREVGVSELIPVCEVATGVVLTGFVYQGKHYHIISKSGGFGEPDLFCSLAERIVGS